MIQVAAMGIIHHILMALALLAAGVIAFLAFCFWLILVLFKKIFGKDDKTEETDDKDDEEVQRKTIETDPLNPDEKIAER